jgi:hypothetical protein
MKSKVLTILAFSVLPSLATSVLVTNSNGPTNTREVANSGGTLVTGFGAVGIIDESGITGVTTTYDALAFEQWGSASGNVTTSTTGQFSFTANVNPTGTNFSGRNIYLLVGFGGTNLATSTELFIYSFNTTFGVANSGTPINLTLGNGNIGTTLFGTEVGNPETAGSGRFRSAALAPVPEPSAALLGMLGALGLLRRRR